MSRRPLVILLSALLSPGCVPVAEPVGDIEKSKPDKTLIGTWALAERPERPVVRIDLAPEVKENPSGLMTETDVESNQGKTLFFFVSTIGKHSYANFCFERGSGNGLARLDKEGEYRRWSRSPDRRFCVIHYVVEKDSILINSGDTEAFKGLMRNEKFESVDKDTHFKIPAGWLAKYLEKNGPEKLFPEAEAKRLIRVKK
jgi:hypothetical protein